MDLYEALKSGTSADELTRKFHDELAAAQKKIKKENGLSKARTYLADAIYEYMYELTGTKGIFSAKDIENVIEEVMEKSNDFMKGFNKSLSDTDEDIINAFLKSLK